MAKIITDNVKYKLNNQNKMSKDIGLGNIIQSGCAVKKGSFTTVGGDAAETITDADVSASDLVVVVVETAGATPRSVVAANAASGSIAVTMSGDPSTDHVLNYIVFKA